MQLDWVSFALESINFLVLVWILQRFLYRPVLQTIARRKAVIERSLADAAARQESAQALESQYRGRLDHWEREKAGLRGAALAQADAERAQRMDALRQALDAERERSRVLQERELSERRGRLAEEAAAQGASFAARLLTRLAAPGVEARVLDMVCEDLAALPEAQREALAAACRESGARARVTSAFPLADSQQRALLAKLRAVLRTDVAADFDQDAKLRAGLRVGIGPWVLRANFEDELAFFAEGAKHAS